MENLMKHLMENLTEEEKKTELVSSLGDDFIEKYKDFVGYNLDYIALTVALDKLEKDDDAYKYLFQVALFILDESDRVMEEMTSLAKEQPVIQQLSEDLIKEARKDRANKAE